MTSLADHVRRARQYIARQEQERRENAHSEWLDRVQEYAIHDTAKRGAQAFFEQNPDAEQTADAGEMWGVRMHRRNLGLPPPDMGEVQFRLLGHTLGRPSQ